MADSTSKLTAIQIENDGLIDAALNRILRDGRRFVDRDGGEHRVDPTAADISAAIRRCEQLGAHKAVAPGTDAADLLKRCGYTVKFPKVDDADDDATRETATA